jgi:serine/threonine protein kinase
MRPGTRLVPNEIVAPLGAGWRAEVWRARDERLGREVAIKVLPAEATADLNRLGRFEQVACSASALNRPNILTVFDVGPSLNLVKSKSLSTREIFPGKRGVA